MKFNKKYFILLLTAFFLLLNFNPLFAEDPTITFLGEEDGFNVNPGSDYTDTDLFTNFKNVMPGDVLEEDITIINEAEDCAYINLYLHLQAHDETLNPLSYDEEYEVMDGNDQSEVDGERDEDLVSMQEFLSKIKMSIYADGLLIYESTADQSANLENDYLLAKLFKDEKVDLKVTLELPKELNNAYANRVGEIDWILKAEAIQYAPLTVHKVWDDRSFSKRPEEITLQVFKEDKTTQVKELFEEIVLSKEDNWVYSFDELDDRYHWTVEEIVPKGYHAEYTLEDNILTITNKSVVVSGGELIHTGQTTWPIPLLYASGIILILLGFYMLGKRNENA